MSIGSVIANRRKDLGITQGALAEKLDVSFQAVSLWERDESLPDTDRLQDIAAALSIRVSELFEEEGVEPSHWDLKDEMFSVDHMYKRVQEYSRAKRYTEALTAIRVMKKAHEGQFRKGKDHIPYIFHPLLMACHAFALGIDDDELISTILLHDVLEDCDVTEEELGVNAAITEAVKLLSYTEPDGMSEEEAMERYYCGIASNRIATIVKLLDRCNNVSTMAMGFTRKKMAEYIEETERYVYPLFDIVKENYDTYYNAAFLLKYQMKSILESLKRTL